MICSRSHIKLGKMPMSKSMSLSWAGLLLLHLTHFLALLSILSLVLNQVTTVLAVLLVLQDNIHPMAASVETLMVLVRLRKFTFQVQ